jgi:hypothetical protein
MEAFTELRKLARQRRDKAIAVATREYNDTLQRIAAVEQDLLGKQRSDHKTVAGTILQAIPLDRPFTTEDVMAGLRAMDPLADWRMASVTNQIGRLRQRGLVRRLRRPCGKHKALYVRVCEPADPVDRRS